MASDMYTEILQDLGYGPIFDTDAPNTALVDDLAKVVGVALPEEYVAFLREAPVAGMFNGKGAVFTQSGGLAVEFLYAACSKTSYDVLALASQLDEGDGVPKHLLQVGGDFFGNAFCLDLRTVAFGEIVFWDHEARAAETSLRRVARDFESFLNSLTLDPS